MLIRTDSTFVRTTQLDNHYVANDARADARVPSTASISRTHSQCQRRSLTLLPRRTADPVSSSWKTCTPPSDGGASRDRTDDLKLAKLALSQLSYGPVVCFASGAGADVRRLGCPRISSGARSRLRLHEPKARKADRPPRHRSASK